MNEETTSESKPKIIEEIFEASNKAFTRHLGIKNNHRIIFSGRYGIGKTTFLKEFFTKKKYLDFDEKSIEYKCIHLYPVNYQVGENIDVFEYIKYDILIRLLMEDDLEIDNEQINLSTALPFLLENNIAETLSTLTHLAEPILTYTTKVKGVSSAFDKILTLKEKLKKEFEKVNKDNEYDRIKELINSYRNTKGSIYEHDLYSILISNLLDRWTESELVKGEKKKQYKSVLIIDDLDRIDPHHAFRLFNIFSAHFDQKEEDINKFGFNKIIFVCDIENVRSIFSHFYGGSVSFSGYIDKFYSKIPYYFNPIDEIVKHYDKFSSTTFKFYGFGGLPNDDKRLNESYQEIIYNGKSFFKNILALVIKANGLSIRNLIRIENNEIEISCYSKHRLKGNQYSDARFLIVIVAHILLHYAGSSHEVYYILKRCESLVSANPQLVSDVRMTMIRHSLAYLSLYANIEEDNQTLSYNLEDGTIIKYELKLPLGGLEFVDVDEMKVFDASALEGEIKINNINPFVLLIPAIQKYYNLELKQS